MIRMIQPPRSSNAHISGLSFFNSGARMGDRTVGLWLKTIGKIYMIDSKYDVLVKKFKEAYEKNKSRYLRLAKQMGIPPELLAVIHYREDSDDYMKGGFSLIINCCRIVKMV